MNSLYHYQEELINRRYAKFNPKYFAKVVKIVKLMWILIQHVFILFSFDEHCSETMNYSLVHLMR